MEYKIVNFKNSNNPAVELDSIIKSEAENGYKYLNHQYSDKLQGGSAGCFGIGATPPTTVHIGFVILVKE